MIKSWKLGNFKSVSKEIDLEFKPLTIFAGANSSGKSTIIQSMLLTAQTIQNTVYSKSVILNGHISKFGAFNDIVSKSNPKSPISIGFSLEPKLDSKDKLMSRYYPSYRGEIIDLNCRFSFLPDTYDDIGQLQPKLTDLTISSNRRDTESNDKINIHIYKSNLSIEERMTKYSISSMAKTEESALEYAVEISDKHLDRFIYYRMPYKLEYIGARLFHFLPHRLIGLYNSLEDQIHSFIDILTGKNSDTSLEFIENEDILLNDVTKKLITDVLKNIEFKSNTRLPSFIFGVPQAKEKISKLLENFTKDKLETCLKDRPIMRASSPIFEEKIQDFVNNYNTINKNNYYVTQSYPVHFPEVEYIDTTFRKNLKYLGPLRDNPKSVYPLEGYADPSDIGYRGENTAAVLDINKNQEIIYIPTLEFDNNKENKSELKTTLKIAVLDWLKYLGVATNVNTVDKGKLGHELTVSTDNSSVSHDLTHVGVGVSQVLPILVLSLLSKSDTTLIFEQPELHLHPKVQTRLADFFHSMNLLKKQCVVETHSEYLINRLRYLVATSQGDEIANNTILYFVEKENSESIYKPIKINKYGVIENWPKGFFDESEQIASAMLKASMEKRKNEGV